MDKEHVYSLNGNLTLTKNHVVEIVGLVMVVIDDLVPSWYHGIRNVHALVVGTIWWIFFFLNLKTVVR